MGRTSDTRQRTREAAADLVRQGHRPHEITVDLIYAAIAQGSRTTINDELRNWKDEKARAETLDADIPPVVADSMRSLWVLAVEQGERAFDQRREELETELTAAREALSETKSALEGLQASSDLAVRQFKLQITTLEQQLTEIRSQVASETAIKNAALENAQALRAELSAVRLDAAQQLDSVRQEQARQAAEYQRATTNRDVTFRAELAVVTQRLESAQAQMLNQIDSARQAQRRAESEVEKVRQQREELLRELEQLKLQSGLRAHEFQRARVALEKSTEAANRWADERQTLMTALARSEGRAESLRETVKALETRAVAAESLLADALAREVAQSSSKARRRDKPPSND